MTIVQPSTLKTVYNMNGVRDLPFSFPVANEDDIIVLSYDTTTGEQVLLTIGADYTVSFQGDLPSIGSIYLLNSNLFNDTNFQVTLTRFTGQVQEYDMSFEQEMNPVQLEYEMDRRTMMAQDSTQLAQEAIRFPSSEIVEDNSNVLPTKAIRTNSLLGFDADGNFSTSATLFDDAIHDATELAIQSAEDAEQSAIDAENSANIAQASETNVLNIINDAGINEINLTLGSRVDGTATLTYGGRV